MLTQSSMYPKLSSNVQDRCASATCSCLLASSGFHLQVSIAPELDNWIVMLCFATYLASSSRLVKVTDRSE